MKDLTTIGPETLSRELPDEGAGVLLGAVLLRTWLIANCHTQEALARVIGVSQSRVSLWLASRLTPSRQYKLKLQKTCGIPCDSWSIDVSAQKDNPSPAA